MRLQVLPYVTVEVDDRLRRRLRRAGERLRVNVRAYLLSAADDVDAAGDKVRDLCDRAVNRVDSVVATVNDRLGADERPAAAPAPWLPGAKPASGYGVRAPARAPTKKRPGDHHQADDGHRNRPCPSTGHRRLALGDVVGVRDDLVEYRQVGRVVVVRLLRG